MPCHDRQLDNAFEAISWWRTFAGTTETCSVSGTGAIQELELALAQIHQVARVTAVSSGTAALLCSMLALNVQPGTRVLVPGAVWPAARIAAQTLGAEVVELSDWTKKSIAAGLASRNPIVISVPEPHNQANFAEIANQLTASGIPVIEDLAALPKPAGLNGKLATISLGSGKAINAGEGGAILTNDHDLADSIERISQHPVRQALRGLQPNPNALCLRMHPVAAVVALHAIVRGNGAQANPNLRPAQTPLHIRTQRARAS